MIYQPLPIISLIVVFFWFPKDYCDRGLKSGYCCLSPEIVATLILLDPVWTPLFIKKRLISRGEWKVKKRHRVFFNNYLSTFLLLNPWVEKTPWIRKWHPISVSLPGKSHGQSSLVDYSPRGHRVRHDRATNTHTPACFRPQSSHTRGFSSSGPGIRMPLKAFRNAFIQ